MRPDASHGITVSFFKHGAIVNYGLPCKPTKGGKAGRQIKDASLDSMRHAAFVLGNAKYDWGAMATLTHQVQPKDLKLANRSFRRAVVREFGLDFQWAWFMEFQRRGVVHYHWFFERDTLDERGYLHPSNLETIVRWKKKNGQKYAQPTTLIRGDFERWIVRHWTLCAHAQADKACAFNAGGIVELLRHPDAAGRYVAAYATKKGQKHLPRGVDGAGQWWRMSKAGRPQEEKVVRVTQYPFPKCYKYVYDKRVFDELIEERDPLLIWPKVTTDTFRGEPINGSFNNVKQLTFLPDPPLLEE